MMDKIKKANLVKCLSNEVKKIYAELFKEIPNIFYIDTKNTIDIPKFIKKLRTEYVKNFDKYEVNSYSSKGEISQYTVIIDPSTVVNPNRSPEILCTDEDQITIYSRDEYPNPIIREIFESCIIPLKDEGVLSLITYSDGEYNLVDGKVKKMDIDIDLLYNDGFHEVYDRTVDFLKNDESGLIIWHGSKGTGNQKKFLIFIRSY